MIKLDMTPIIMHCICSLHNFLIKADDMVNVPIIGPLMWYFGSRTSQSWVERLRNTRNIGGYYDRIRLQDK